MGDGFLISILVPSSCFLFFFFLYIFWAVFSSPIFSQRVPAVPMCSVQCQCQFIYSNLVWYHMPELLYVITYRGIQMLWFIAWTLTALY